MYVFTSKFDLQKYLATLSNKKILGFVPTMGVLHEGHLELIKQSKRQCNTTICSIFINPTQFNNAEDLASYPNSLQSDLEKLEQVRCDIVYTPTVADIYQKSTKPKVFGFGPLATSMEGKFRPGHFNGMATVVEKFFNIIKPTMAFFGEKDLQQLQLVKALVKQMKSSIKVVGIPTVREKNGLAKSSRNELLSQSAKEESALIYNCLYYCKKNKKKGLNELKAYIQDKFKKQKTLKLEYAEFVSLSTMQPIKKWEGENKNAICIAAYHSGVRLIDNIIL
tara:strand:- start:415 stop:1251 length:837 start_codon:yes stop_codon:yes gene_type:complete